LERAEEILNRLEAKGFASDNVVLGIGSYTYQYVTRDTLGFAMKATNIVVDGEDIPLWKDPKTDNGVKKSAKGLLSVLPNNTSKFALYSNVSREQEELGLLTTLYIDGEWMKFQTLEDIRAVLAK
jgi:nicotinamide phosphoribosyltransferase